MIILGTNSIKDTGGYQVDNSLRFNTGSSDYLNRTATSGNRQVATFSGWVKKSSQGVDTNRVFLEYNSGTNYFEIRFREGSSRETIRIYEELNGGTGFELITNREFADLGAWYHIAVVIKTTEGTAANRIKLYINGVQETSFATETYPAQNYNVQMNVADKAVQIGAYSFSGSNYFNGYMSEMVWLDGTAAAITDLGEFDEDSGIWKPKDVSGLTFGTNGFYLDFEDSSALGNDAAGSNNFTVNNLTAIDQSTDTCTNNFATFNSLSKNDAGTITFSEGNLKTAHSGTDSRYAAYSTIGVSQGKWYAEFKYEASSGGTDVHFGIGSDIENTNRTGSNLYSSSTGYSYFSSDGSKGNNDSSSSYGNSFAVGDIIGIALDLDNYKLYFSKNGVFQNSGNPTSGATGTGSAFNLTSGETYFFAGTHATSTSRTSTYSANFGSPPYSISSGNTDGDGYGNFEYAVPSGYYALNTKNLAEYG